MPEPQEQPPPDGGRDRGSALEKVAYVTAPATVVLGLLYYFGRTYTDAYYAYFGIPANDLQLSLHAYVAKSATAVFFPLWLLLVCGLVVLLMLGAAGRALAGPGREAVRRRVVLSLLALGMLLVLAGFPAFFLESRMSWLPQGWVREFLPCLIVALGATLAFFAVQMHLGRPLRDDRDRGALTGDRLWLAGGALLIGLLTLSLFFAMARYAAHAGMTTAAGLAATGCVDEECPRVVVHSKVPVPHHLEGIKAEDRGLGMAPYRYQYLGFRLLAKSPARFYLISHALPRQEPRLAVIPDDDSIRLEISP
ncbi:hypothetical protein SUDANB120_02255 [Streptomyces sp. enrichment culture]|uniref:hypothetical protein n=1 Tax=Streptomyces sp. enrichment culture TaxID=1795815 RepID=UPI003F548BBE